MADALLTPRRLAALERVPHAIPYQGSKRGLAHAIVPLIPPGTQRLIEPFAGSAAVTIAALHTDAVQRAVASDLNGPLVELWHRIAADPETLADSYDALWLPDLADARARYLEVRSRFNETQTPEDFLYLLARCVKAAVRYNVKGEFNQGADQRRLGVRPVEMRRRLTSASAVVRRRVDFRKGDYAEHLHGAAPDDVVYMDPPYQGTSGTRDARYLAGLAYEDFVVELKQAVANDVSMLISYDGSSGEKTYGQDLPADLDMLHLHLAAGASSQATLSGAPAKTVESLYVSPALVERLGGRAEVLRALQGDVLL